LQRASKELQEAEMFRDKMSSVQTWMTRLKLPLDLRAKIRAYYAEVRSAHHMTVALLVWIKGQALAYRYSGHLFVGC